MSLVLEFTREEAAKAGPHATGRCTGTGEETAACARANARTRKGRRHARGRTRACAKAKRNGEARMQEPKCMRATVNGEDA